MLHTLFQETAPVSKVFLWTALVIRELQGIIVGIGKLRKTKQSGGSGFPGIIDAWDTKPVMAVLFDQEQMVIIVISVEQEAVVGKVPVLPRQDRHLRTLDLLDSLRGSGWLCGRILALGRNLFAARGLLHGRALSVTGR